MSIEDLVIPHKGQQFGGLDFRALLNPGVYIFLKNERPTYIGMGKILLNSLSRKNSHCKRQIALEECDRVLLYPCKSVEAAIELEKLLIGRLKPANNTRLKPKMYTRRRMFGPIAIIPYAEQQQISNTQSL